MAKAKTTKERLEFLEDRVAKLESLVNACNNAIIGIAYVAKVKGDELDKLSNDDYKNFITEHVHPLTIQATKIVNSIVKETKEELDKEGKK